MKPLEIACDESGNDGENLFAGNATVFADASVSTSTSDARSVVDELRSLTRSRAPEFKAARLLAHRSAVLRLLTHPAVASRANIHLSEKRYFLVGKLVDLVIEEVLHERGEDIYRDRRARKFAWALYNEAPSQVGATWGELLNSFNALTRVRENADKTADLIRFRTLLAITRQSATGLVRNLLRLVAAGDEYVYDLARDSSHRDSARILQLHPVFAALGQTARTWHERTGREIALIHDMAPGLTARRGQLLIDGLTPSSTLALGVQPVPLRAVTFVDSKADPRVQLADLYAGVGRAYAERALAGDKDDEVLNALRPHLDGDSVWGDQKSWQALMGRRLGE